MIKRNSTKYKRKNSRTGRLSVAPIAKVVGWKKQNFWDNGENQINLWNIEIKVERKKKIGAEAGGGGGK